jgi:Endonuclease/Exonuclease/phosphatase family
MRLRVLTVNVQHDAGDPRRTGLLNRELRRLDPDRHGGTAVATRWPHRVVEVLDERPPEGSDDHDWTLAVSVRLPDLGELLLIVPTTAWRLDAEAARERQAVQVADLDARHRRRLPTIVAGDLNAAPEAASIRFLSGLQTLNGRSVHYSDAWAVAGHGPGRTRAVDNPVAAAEIDRLVGQPGHRRPDRLRLRRLRPCPPAGPDPDPVRPAGRRPPGRRRLAQRPRRRPGRPRLRLTPVGSATILGAWPSGSTSCIRRGTTSPPP